MNDFFRELKQDLLLNDQLQMKDGESPDLKHASFINIQYCKIAESHAAKQQDPTITSLIFSIHVLV